MKILLRKWLNKEHQRNKKQINEPLAGKGRDYKRNAKFQIETLEKKVEELERELFKIQERKKPKQDSDEDLDIIDDETPKIKKNMMPDVRISTKNKKGAKNSIILKETLKTIKEKDQEIIVMKDQIKKNQIKLKLKNREIFKLKTRLKNSTVHTTQ